jgi:hypothetical protein
MGRHRQGTTAPSWAPPWLRHTAALLGAFYLMAVFLDASGVGLLSRVLPPPIRFFTQVAELFPHAAQDAIDWRARAYHCDGARFEELDVRPFFPIRRDDKESRFYRAMFFHFRQRPVLEALEAYVVREQNRRHPEARIGGLMLLSLRIPIPPPGSGEARYRRLPISDYPSTVERHYWYVSSPEASSQRCEATP